MRKLVLRILAALAIGALLIALPLPGSDTVIAIRSAVISFFIVVYIGKTVYDTLFYNRFFP